MEVTKSAMANIQRQVRRKKTDGEMAVFTKYERNYPHYAIIHLKSDYWGGDFYCGIF